MVEMTDHIIKYYPCTKSNAHVREFWGGWHSPTGSCTYLLCDGVDAIVDLEPLVWLIVVFVELLSDVRTDVAEPLLDGLSTSLVLSCQH